MKHGEQRDKKKAKHQAERRGEKMKEMKYTDKEKGRISRRGSTRTSGVGRKEKSAKSDGYKIFRGARLRRSGKTDGAQSGCKPPMHEEW